MFHLDESVWYLVSSFVCASQPGLKHVSVSLAGREIAELLLAAVPRLFLFLFYFYKKEEKNETRI